MSRAIVLSILLALAGACRLPYEGGARPVSAAQMTEPGWYRAPAVPAVKQQAEADCGLAALAMMGGAWGKLWTVPELTAAIPPSPQGVRLGSLRDYARDHGLEAFAIQGTPADLARELAAGRPVLLGLVLPYDQKHNLSHYEVAVAMNPRDGTVITLDPATGTRLSRAAKVLDLEWKTAGYATLVVTDRRAVAATQGASP